VGLVTAACFAEMGHRVICMDQDRKKLAALRKGKAWFYEPGLEELMVKNLKKKRLFFTARMEEGVRKSEIIFIAVGTPPLPSGDADLTSVEQVVRQIARAADGYRLIVEKSTVPVETGLRIKQTLEIMAKRKAPVEVASNPEFLREGSAVHDFFHPDRVVIGVESARAKELLEDLYRPLDAPLVDFKVDHPFRHGDRLPGGMEAVHIPDNKSPGESALLLRRTPNVLILGDALIGNPAGRLTLLPPEKYADVTRAREGIRVLLGYEFGPVLTSDGASILEHGRRAVEAFLENG